MSRRRCSRLITPFLFISLLVLAAQVDADFCASPGQKPSVRLAASFDNDASFKAPHSAELEAARFNLSVLFTQSILQMDGYDSIAGVVHNYSTLSAEGINPAAQTNGDLHTLALPWYWSKKTDQIERRFGLAAAISTSSNGLKNPDELNHQALQLWLSWEDRRPINKDWDWLLGICGDHRFGKHRFYPLVGVVRKIGAAGMLRLAFPDLHFSWPLTDQLRFDLRVEPMGNKWSVYDDSLERESSFLWRSWSASAEFNWRLFDEFGVFLRAGQRFEQELKFKLADDSRLKSRLDDTFYWSLGLVWWL